MHVKIDLHDDKDQLRTLEEKFEALYEEEQQKDDDLTKKLPKSSFSTSSSTSSSSDEETSPSVTKLIAKIESKSSPNQISQYKPKISSNDNNKENKNEDPEAIFEHLYESTVKDEIGKEHAFIEYDRFHEIFALCNIDIFMIVEEIFL